MMVASRSTASLMEREAIAALTQAPTVRPESVQLPTQAGTPLSVLGMPTSWSSSGRTAPPETFAGAVLPDEKGSVTVEALADEEVSAVMDGPPGW
jgi:hypothetical protein